MDKTLKSKAVKIQGKDYILVSDRVLYFNETYPNGGIMTVLVSEPSSDHIVMKAIIVPDWTNPERQFTGYSQAVVGQGMVNKSAALENAETSAVGRALGMMGIGVIESIASADELNKALGASTTSKGNPTPTPASKPLKSAPTASQEVLETAPCDAVSCKNVAKTKYGKLCYNCAQFVKTGGIIKKLRSEGAVQDEEVPLSDIPF